MSNQQPFTTNTTSTTSDMQQQTNIIPIDKVVNLQHVTNGHFPFSSTFQQTHNSSYQHAALQNNCIQQAQTLLPTVFYNYLVLNQQMSQLLNMHLFTCPNVVVNGHEFTQPQQQEQQETFIYDEFWLESLFPTSNDLGETMLKGIRPEDLLESCHDEFMLEDEIFNVEKTTCNDVNLLQLLNCEDVSPACSSVNHELMFSQYNEDYSKLEENGVKVNTCESTSTDSNSFNSSNVQSSLGNTSPTSSSCSSSKSYSKQARRNSKETNKTTEEPDMTPLYNSLIKKKRGRPPKVNFKVEFSEHAYSMIYNGKVEEAIKVESASSRRGKSRVLKSIPKHILSHNNDASNK